MNINKKYSNKNNDKKIPQDLSQHGNAWNTSNASSLRQHAIYFSRPDKFEQLKNSDQ